MEYHSIQAAFTKSDDEPASCTLVRNALGSPWVHAPEALPERAAIGCKAPTLTRKSSSISVVEVPMLSTSPNMAKSRMALS